MQSLSVSESIEHATRFLASIADLASVCSFEVAFPLADLTSRKLEIKPLRCIMPSGYIVRYVIFGVAILVSVVSKVGHWLPVGVFGIMA